jgi:haloacid dehalogenase superfamily, subfamily IA, variant 3 with third motif having DD or ED
MIDFSSIKALFFDFGGVLINLDKQLCLDNLYKITGCDFSEMVSNYRQSGIFLRFEKGLATEQEFYDEIRSASRYPVTDEQIRDAWASFLLNVPEEKKQLLLALRKHFKVFMLSNTNVVHVNHSMTRNFDIDGHSRYDYFDKCYFSNEIHMAKPDPEIFEYILKDSGFRPEECLFLDDGEKNIDVASAMGFQTYLVQPREDLRPLFKTVLDTVKTI